VACAREGQPCGAPGARMLPAACAGMGQRCYLPAPPSIHVHHGRMVQFKRPRDARPYQLHVCQRACCLVCRQRWRMFHTDREGSTAVHGRGGGGRAVRSQCGRFRCAVIGEYARQVHAVRRAEAERRYRTSVVKIRQHNKADEAQAFASRQANGDCRHMSARDASRTHRVADEVYAVAAEGEYGTVEWRVVRMSFQRTTPVQRVRECMNAREAAWFQTQPRGRGW